MDDVERMYRHLVRTIRTSYPQYLTQPFEVGELYQTILPYRLHRRDLGLETNQDYEQALLSLIAGDKGYLVVDGKMRDVLNAELKSANPDTARIREFAGEHVALAPEAIQVTDSGSQRITGSGSTVTRSAVSASRPAEPGKPAPTPTKTSEASSSPSSAESARRAARPLRVAETGETCAFCRGDLPPGRDISFCPHCGQDLTVVHCPACGSELERGWKFCVTCGRAAGV